MNKIDMHVHLTPPCIEKRCEAINRTEPYWQMLAESPKNSFTDAEGLIHEMDRVGIDKSVVFGFSFLDPGLCREVNDYTIEAIRKYPDRLIGFMSVSPQDQKLEHEIARCQDSGLRGIGEMFPDGQHWDITDKSQTAPLIDLCAERKLPVMVHTNERVGHYYPGKVSTTPLEASRLAEHHPDATFIFAHWGGGLPFYELMKEVRKNNRNVYYDTAASIFLYDNSIFRVARELDVLDRVLFASDYPLVSPERYFDYIDHSGLNQEELEAVYYSNAQRLLGE
jgi:hypothetical protein